MKSSKALSFYTFIVLCLSLASAAQLHAQTDSDSLKVISYRSPQEFEIGGLTVTGANYSDDNAIISISGLKVGDKVRIPGDEIARAIKALWKLRLFTDVQVVKTKTIGDVVFLDIRVQERPRLSRHSFEGAKKTYHDDLNDEVNKHLLKGGIVTEDVKVNAARAIEKFFINKGFLDAKVTVDEFTDTSRVNSVRLVFNVDRNDRIKINSLAFNGNEAVADKKLRSKMKKTRQKKRLFASSKLIRNEYDNDKKEVIKYYNTVGFRDARILSDSMWRDEKGHVNIALKVEEGNRYYFRDITWKGNSIYDTLTLSQRLGISKGDVYNQELLETRLRFSQDGRDVSTLYMDNGYLFFQVDPTEVAIDNDSIDLEIRIFEGPQATIDKVVIKGNDRTHEHVVRRELRTLPGEKFSRSDIIRSQRQVVNLGYFNPEKLDIATPVNPQRGTVDIVYTVEEKPSDQLELSAGWGGFNRVIGTLGVSFNNFSARNIFNKAAWSPLPQGDGQRLSIRAQTNGEFFQSYNTSFTEPWLGGKKPNSFTVAGFYNRFNYSRFGNGGLNIIQGTLSFGTRLKWPDDNFVASTALNIQTLELDDWVQGIFRTDQGEAVTTGKFNNFSISQTFARSSIDDPLFPRGGSSFSLTAQLTLPYSYLFNKNKVYDGLTAQERFRWLEYHKWKFSAEWYTTLVDKLVLKARARIGMIGFYNKEIGTSPFERFQVGGNGLNNQQIAFNGVDIISARGYKETEFAANIDPDPTSGNRLNPTPVYNKYTVELRYPVSLNPSSTIYVLTFAEGVNTWRSLRDYNPFDLRRSVGVGLRVFLPMFGLLGFDYGIGLDKDPNVKEIGTFNIILGFEPD